MVAAVSLKSRMFRHCEKNHSAIDEEPKNKNQRRRDEDKPYPFQIISAHR